MLSAATTVTAGPLYDPTGLPACALELYRQNDYFCEPCTGSSMTYFVGLSYTRRLLENGLLLQKVINKTLCALGQSENMHTETLEHNLSHVSRHYIDVNRAQIRLIASRGILGQSVVQERTVLVCLVLKPYRNMLHGMLDALSPAPTAFSDMGLDAIDVFTLLQMRTLEIKHATQATSRSVLMDSRCAWNALITYQPMPNIRR